jgi:hypothetical protein
MRELMYLLKIFRLFFLLMSVDYSGGSRDSGAGIRKGAVSIDVMFCFVSA